MSKRGKYIVIEGLDGSGKTTQFELLREKLGAVGVREPGGTPMAEAVRTLIKDSALVRDPETNIWLFMTARAELNKLVIEPSLEQGKIVVSDRNWRSTEAYQAAEGTDTSKVLELAELAMKQNTHPDLTIFIDVPILYCTHRIRKRNPGREDYFDHLGVEFFKRVEKAYKQNLQESSKVAIVNGVGSPEEVAERVNQAVSDKLNIRFDR